MGVDLFDLHDAGEAAANGVLLTSWGPRLPLEHEPTSVEAYSSSHAQGHGRSSRQAVNSGTLVPAVRQSQSSPRLVEHLRRHQELAAKHQGNLASHMPAATEFPCFSPNALNDPLVVDWERFIVEHYETSTRSRRDDFASCSSQKALPFVKISRAVPLHHRLHRLPCEGHDDLTVGACSEGP